MEQPYIERVVIEKRGNPNYPQDEECACGHEYYRHFDSYSEDWDPIGCKYCSCWFFEKRI